MSTSAPRGTGELSLRARPHLASTACALRQQPASTACVNTLRQHRAVPRAHYKGNPQFPLFPGPTTKEIFNFLCSRGPLQRKSSISFVPRAHYKGNPQFPLFPGPTTKGIFNFLCSQSPLQRKSAISFVRRTPSCVNTLRQQPESIDVQS